MRVLLVHPSALMYSEHQRPVHYELPVPEQRTIAAGNRRELYIHTARNGSRAGQTR